MALSTSPHYTPQAGLPWRWRSRGRHSCRGQGTVEFLLAAVPVLLLGFGSIEAIHWYFARQAVSLALTQAARAGITQQADPVAIDHAFARALLPMYAGPSTEVSQARLQRSMQRRTATTHLPAWRIDIVSPSPAAFHDFASTDPELTRRAGEFVIDNDYLHEQHQRRVAQGWPEGRGPQSGQITLEANTLVLHLTWLHEPLLPGVRNLMRQLAPADSRYGSLAMLRGGYVPIHREVALVMQSHAAEQPLPSHGRVTRHGPDDSGSETNTAPDTGETPNAGVPAAGERPPCVGLWCLREPHASVPPGGSESSGTVPPFTPGPPGGSGSGAAAGPGAGPTPGAGPPPGPPADQGSEGSGNTNPEQGEPAAPPEPSLIDPEDCPGCCS